VLRVVEKLPFFFAFCSEIRFKALLPEPHIAHQTTLPVERFHVVCSHKAGYALIAACSMVGFAAKSNCSMQFRIAAQNRIAACSKIELQHAAW